MPSPRALPSDITSRWIGEGVPDDDAQLTILISDAETKIARAVPDLEDRLDEPIADGGVSADEVRLIIVAMVTRLYRNPEGVRTRQDTTGPFGNSKTFAGDNLGRLHITDEELTTLRGQIASDGGSAFSIDPAPNAGARHYIGGADTSGTWVNGPDPW